MAHVYLDISGVQPVNIFAADDHALVAGYQVNTGLLDHWTPEELAALDLVRAPVSVPEIAPTTEMLTGEYGAVQSEGGLAWVAQSRHLTAEETAAKLAAAKTERLAHLRACCALSIVAGFASNALGDIHTYPSSPTDQINMLGRVAQAQIDPAVVFAHWCADANGAWVKRLHTAAQMIQVGQDGAAWVQTNSDRLSGPDGDGGLIGQVQAATTIAEVNAVEW